MVFVSSTFAHAQEEDIFGIDTKARPDKTRRSESGVGNITRGILSKISLELSVGYGLHQNSMDFTSGMPANYPIVPLGGDPNAQDIVAGETTAFESNSSAVPFDAGVRIDLFGLFSIGGGYGREMGNMAALESSSHQFNFSNDRYVFDKMYGTLGLVLYDANRRQAFLKWKYRKYSSNNHYMQAEQKLRMEQRYPWRFTLEGEYGSIKVQESYDDALTATEPYYAIGLRIEREFSEYTKIFLKPNASFRKFNYQLPGLEESQMIEQSLFTINLGVALRLPGTKRCKIPGCGVKMKHLHNGVEYRGSSIWHMQNRKVGQWY
ncbi:hypothetical protein [Echinicola vietnamensis]|uniref:Uncharacterized protein n=1 Tax=Echinicola vietnamensis (strain DSM 17526 / LMG 23754 / KMM 6221) TaxID=926556 RepID=L0G0R3_ECHVK|nr:hypothetical protein [Echinicola vietnamensis]AGA79789.1 hypothetical protein Echvi_3573 [Echinicola vietnamensis DSM 17526]